MTLGWRLSILRWTRLGRPGDSVTSMTPAMDRFRGRWDGGRVVDLAVVALATLQAWSLLTSTDEPIRDHRVPLLTVATLSVLVLLARRRAPMLVSLVSLTGLASGAALSPVIPAATFLVILASFAVAGLSNPPRVTVAVWLYGCAVIGVAEWSTVPATDRVGDLALTLAFCTAMWAAGVLVSRHMRRAQSALGELAGERADRAEQIRLATERERSRIAVDLHDVVSHGLSVVVLQSVAARSALALGSDETRDQVGRRLEVIESTARDGLAEMRRMLGLLDSLDSADPLADAAVTPVPSLGLLPRLLEQAEAAGVSVAAARIELAGPLSAGVELTVYRVIQEAVTNAMRHAPGSSISVAITSDGTALSAVVENTASPDGPSCLSAAGSGRGIIGMNQRARVHGGSLRAGPRADGGYRVQLLLPADPA